MEVLLSKRRINRLGTDKDSLFAKNPDVSVIDIADSLAFAIRILATHNNIIKDYNPYKLRRIYHQRYKSSPHQCTIKRYVDTLIKFGFCVMDGKCLVFKKVRSKRKERNFVIEIDDSMNIKSVGKEIAKHIITSPMRLVGYVSLLKDALANPVSLKALKEARRRKRGLSFDVENFKENGISYSMLMSRFNVSRSYVAKMLKLCEDDGIIKRVKRCVKETYQNFSSISRNLNKFIASIRDYITYYFYNPITDTLKLFKILCNTYIYNPYIKEELSYI